MAVVSLAVAGLWLLYTLRHVILLTATSLVLAAGLSRVSVRLERAGFSRLASVGLITLGLLVTVATALVALVSPIVQEGDTIVQGFVAFGARVVETFFGLHRQFPFLPAPEGSAANATEQVLEETGRRIRAAVAPEDIARTVLNILGGAVTALFGAAVALYLAIDRELVRDYVLSFSPLERRQHLETLLDRVGQRTGGWLVGQVTICAIVAVVTFVALALLRVKFALLLGLVAGLAEFIPFVGPLSAAVLATTVAASQSTLQAVATLAFFIVYQQTDSYLIAPWVMGRAVRVHVVVVLLAVAVGAELFGIVGALLAPALAAALSIVLDELRTPAGPATAASDDGDHADPDR
ncbi:MAG: AI-2E family transporter [Chloroflexi bacterium]|nr:AI-2E family transporter [Chloroflexota bacterium]